MLKHRLNSLSESIIGCAITVHRELGPGMLESAYEVCLYHELTLAGFHVQRQLPLGINYKGIELEAAFRIDLLIDNLVIVELKSIAKLEKIHEAQLQTYLRLSKLHLGLLINCNVLKLVDGIKRIVWKFPD